MNSTPFHKFIDLVHFDQNIITLSKKRDSANNLLQKLSEQKNAEKHKLDTVKQIFHDFLKKRDATELEIASLGHLKVKTEKRLASVANPREYASLQIELETCLTHMDEQEAVLVGLWDAIEQAEENVQQAEKKCASSVKNIEQQIETAQVEYNSCEQELALLSGQRDDKCADIPAEWLSNYRAMQERVPNPVVPVKDAFCTGCFNKVPMSMLDKLRRHVLVACQNCHRILYTV